MVKQLSTNLFQLASHSFINTTFIVQSNCIPWGILCFFGNEEVIRARLFFTLPKRPRDVFTWELIVIIIPFIYYIHTFLTLMAELLKFRDKR